MELKRIFDIVFSAFTLVVIFPLCLFIGFLIKVTSKGPIFYCCPRVGKHGEPIFCWKFRTMNVNAKEELKHLLSHNPALKQEWDLYSKLKQDPRINRVGKFLRKSSLDELPQLWNVLKGDLSIVGPRPATQEEIEKYFRDKASKILSVRPGITGIWQTSGRSLVTFDERIRLEESYIDLKSFKLDLWIIFKTIPVVFSTKGAY